MKKIILIVGLIINTTLIFSQTESFKNEKAVIVIMNDGNQKSGVILNDDGREILLESTTVGKIYIRKSDIKLIKNVENVSTSLIDGEIIDESPFTTRYAFTSNAFPVKKNINYAMLNLYGPEIHFAVSNRISLGIMSTWIGAPIALNAKYTLPFSKEKLHYSLGLITGTSSYFANGSGYGGLLWGTTTYGSRTNNISISAGYGKIGSFNSSNEQHGGLLLSIGSIYKLGKKASFIFDSMLSFSEKRENVVIGTNSYSLQNNLGTYDYYYQEITENKMVQNYAFFLMPGFRYQQTDTKAFQVSLAGVINIHDKKTTSFPLPMCSWFYKL